MNRSLFQSPSRRARYVPWHSRRTWISLAAVWLASCSLRNLDNLGPGSSKSESGGTYGTAGNASGPKGGTALGGGSHVAGTGGTIVAENGGTTGIGTIPGTGGASEGGAPMTGAGGDGGTAGRATCPQYVTTGGTLLVPPGNGFEEDMLEWGRTSSPSAPSGLSLVSGDATACEGVGYLRCDGDSRSASWDGPAINLIRFMQHGHKYAVSAAVRFDAENPQSGSSQTLGFALGYWCDSKSTAGEASAYIDLHTTRASTRDWTRLKGSFDFPPNCVDPHSVSRLQLYFQTAYGDDTTAQDSFHVDDFRLIDLTGTAGAGGAAGGPNTSAEAGTAGAAGSASAGGH